MNDRAALELALAANPDDFATHAAYADLLTEQGDPRGDYIRLQLALEDRHQPVERLRAMEQEAFELRQRHEAEWLGPLYTHVNPGAGFSRPGVNINVLEANVQVTYRRGWLCEVRVRNLSSEVENALVECPIGRLGSELSIEGGMLVTRRLLEAFPNLTRLSCDIPQGQPQTVTVAASLSWFHPVTDRGPLQLDDVPLMDLLLPFSPLPNLRYLTFRTQACGDVGVQRLIVAGLLDQLRGLDLCNCLITDDGAQALAAHPAVPKLEYLHLDGNLISPIGIDALAAVGVVISQRQRLGPTPGGDDVEVADGEIEF